MNASRDSEFNEAFASIEECARTGLGASLLVQLCKEFDLRDTRYSWAIERMAGWIDSPNEDFRRELVFALCSFRPVAGCEHIAITGWKRAPTGDLHWYARAIENTVTRPEQVTPSVLTDLLNRLFIPVPEADAYPMVQDYEDALAYWHDAVGDTMRVAEHLARLHGIPVEPAGNEDGEKRTPDWKLVAEIYHRVCSRG